MSTKSSKSSENSTLSAKLRERFGDHCKENCPLAPYVRCAVGGVAEYLVEASSTEDITAACTIAYSARRPCAVIGSGTGTIASHVGALGLVIVNQASQMHFAEQNSLVVVESGATTSSLVTAAASRGLGGLEFLMGIPGTIGGAVVTEASYQGRSLASFVKSLVCWVPDGTGSQVVTLSYSEALQLFHEYSQKTNTIAGPVLLAVHLQFARLYPDEILRRLRTYRRRSALIGAAESIIGRPFIEPLVAYPLLSRDIERFRLAGLRYDLTTDTIRAHRLPTQPNDIRAFISSIKMIAAGQGVTLADRLTYLGYWPDEGENESS